jgi:ankyrin repeat protein
MMNLNIYHQCRCNNIATILELLDNGIDVNTPDLRGHTLLYIASFYGHCELLKAIIDRGADINIKTSTGYTPLHEACFRGNKNIVEILLKNGADINVRNNNGETPLHCVGTINHKNIINLLLSYGADINIRTNKGFTPLRLAFINNHYDIVSTFLDKNANIDEFDINKFPEQFRTRYIPLFERAKLKRHIRKYRYLTNLKRKVEDRRRIASGAFTIGGVCK